MHITILFLANNRFDKEKNYIRHTSEGYTRLEYVSLLVEANTGRRLLEVLEPKSYNEVLATTKKTWRILLSGRKSKDEVDNGRNPKNNT